MRTLPAILLAAALAAAGDPPTFELIPAKDWDSKAPDREHVLAYLRTEFADSDPKASAEVRVMVHPLSTELAKKSLDAIARDWAPSIEVGFKEPRRIDEGASKLGDEEAWVRDLRTDWARLTWHLARRGKRIYVFHVIRTYKAVDDEGVAGEIDAMRASFRFLEPKEEARPPEPPQVEYPRETLSFPHWRLECVKPAGLRNVDPEALDKSEKESGVIAKFERTDGEARIMVRIHAQSSSAARFTLEQLAAQKIERFEKTYDEASRKPPKRDDKWKAPLVDRAITLELVGRRRSAETTRWLLAQCKNGRQYQLEIYVAGGDAARWADEIDELMKGFRPVKEPSGG